MVWTEEDRLEANVIEQEMAERAKVMSTIRKQQRLCARSPNLIDDYVSFTLH